MPAPRRRRARSRRCWGRSTSTASPRRSRRTIEFVDHRTVGFGSLHGAEEPRSGARRLVRARRTTSASASTTSSPCDPTRSSSAGRTPARSATAVAPSSDISSCSRSSSRRPRDTHARCSTPTATTRRSRASTSSTAEPAAGANRGSTVSRRAKRERRVRPNAATANAARFDAAMAARDADALSDLFADEMRSRRPPHRQHLRPAGMLASFRSLLRVPGPEYRHEPLATLGDSLALCRLSVSAGAVAGRKSMSAPTRSRMIVLVEVDAQGRRRRAEILRRRPAGRRRRALVRALRRAPPRRPRARPRRGDGARRSRRCWADGDVDRIATALAPDIECVDHRTSGLGSCSGARQQSCRTPRLGRGRRRRHAPRRRHPRPASDTLLVTGRTSAPIAPAAAPTSGISSRSGSSEPTVCSRASEQFDADREDEALARFDELTPSQPGANRRVPRAAPRATERRDRAHAPASTPRSRRETSTRSLAADRRRREVVDHPTGAMFDRAGIARHMALAAQSPGPEVSARAPGDPRRLPRAVPHVDVGDGSRRRGSSTSAPTRASRSTLVEVDAQDDGGGRALRRRPARRRHRPLVRALRRAPPRGPARARAAATARSVAAMTGPFDLDRYAAAFAPDVEFVDHRVSGIGPRVGRKRCCENFRSLLEVAADVIIRIDDILGLRPTPSSCVRRTSAPLAPAAAPTRGRSSCSRSSEPMACVTRMRVVRRRSRRRGARPLRRARRPSQRRAGATAPSRAARVRAPRATERSDRERAPASMPRSPPADADALADPVRRRAAWSWTISPASIYDRQGALAHVSLAAEHPGPDVPASSRSRPSATRSRCSAVDVGERASPARTFDVGAYEHETHHPGRGRREGRRRAEIFATDRLATPSPACTSATPSSSRRPRARRAAATARSVATMLGPFDVDRYATAFAPAVEVVDHRILGTWSARGAEALRSACAPARGRRRRRHSPRRRPRPAAPMRSRCADDSGTAAPAAALTKGSSSLSRSSDADGLLARQEWFDTDRGRGARALRRAGGRAAAARIANRVNASCAEARAPSRPNAATANGPYRYCSSRETSMRSRPDR